MGVVIANSPEKPANRSIIEGLASPQRPTLDFSITAAWERACLIEETSAPSSRSQATLPRVTHLHILRIGLWEVKTNLLGTWIAEGSIVTLDRCSPRGSTEVRRKAMFSLSSMVPVLSINAAPNPSELLDLLAEPRASACQKGVNIPRNGRYVSRLLNRNDSSADLALHSSEIGSGEVPFSVLSTRAIHGCLIIRLLRIGSSKSTSVCPDSCKSSPTCRFGCITDSSRFSCSRFSRIGCGH
jgi:hypothetical protein